MKQIVDGILYLHSHGILHRDLSLANLLLKDNRHIVSTLLPKLLLLKNVVQDQYKLYI